MLPLNLLIDLAPFVVASWTKFLYKFGILFQGISFWLFTFGKFFRCKVSISYSPFQHFLLHCKTAMNHNRDLTQQPLPFSPRISSSQHRCHKDHQSHSCHTRSNSNKGQLGWLHPECVTLQMQSIMIGTISHHWRPLSNLKTSWSSLRVRFTPLKQPTRVESHTSLYFLPIHCPTEDTWPNPAHDDRHHGSVRCPYDTSITATPLTLLTSLHLACLAALCSPSTDNSVPQVALPGVFHLWREILQSCSLLQSRGAEESTVSISMLYSLYSTYSLYTQAGRKTPALSCESALVCCIDCRRQVV